MHLIQEWCINAKKRAAIAALFLLGATTVVRSRYLITLQGENHYEYPEITNVYLYVGDDACRHYHCHRR